MATALELNVAKALYCEQVNNPDYDFQKDPRGWAKVMFLRRARVAIKTVRAYDRSEELKLQV